MAQPTPPTDPAPEGASVGDDERGSEVSDYTGEVPRVAHAPSGNDSNGPSPSGFGDGDVADVDADGAAADADGAGSQDTADEMEALKAERDHFRDAAARWQAEFENFKKRSSANAAADIDRATGRMAESLLPVLDAAETAYVNHPDEVGPLFNALLGELRRQGLESFDLDGAVFDPNTAEAVTHEPGDGNEVVVAEVLRSGYSWKGKTLRAAMVKTTDADVPQGAADSAPAKADDG